MPNVTMETAFSAKWWKEELINALNKAIAKDPALKDSHTDAYIENVNSISDNVPVWDIRWPKKPFQFEVDEIDYSSLTETELQKYKELQNVRWQLHVAGKDYTEGLLEDQKTRIKPTDPDAVQKWRNIFDPQ
tara:strand:+ start:701 stop:1096 length:396 start_codon:yes stop_codon:yes gene_type:complete